MSAWKQKLGDHGEAAATAELTQRGWRVTNLNVATRNYSNADLVAEKGDHRALIQVKTHNSAGWIQAGGVTKKIVDGAPIFNKAGGESCDFVIFLTDTRDKRHTKTLSTKFRYFVLPVSDAERLIRKNVDSYFKDKQHKPGGTCGAFVGPGQCKVRDVPDQTEDFRPYEGAFDLLER